VFRERADAYEARLNRLPTSWEEGRTEAQHRVEALKCGNASLLEIKSAARALANYPKDADEARRRWNEARADNLARAEPVESHITPFPGKDQATSDAKRNNFLALMFCLMVGTAALPHILVRYYTTPSVPETRVSVFWTLFFILLVYTTV